MQRACALFVSVFFSFFSFFSFLHSLAQVLGELMRSNRGRYTDATSHHKPDYCARVPEKPRKILAAGKVSAENRDRLRIMKTELEQLELQKLKSLKAELEMRMDMSAMQEELKALDQTF